MSTSISVVCRFVLAVALAVASPAWGYESLAMRVLGFSPDGRHFGFIQYGGQGDGGEYLADAFVIDTRRDRLVPGATRLVDTVKEEAIADTVTEPDKLLALALARSQPLIKRYDLTKPGRVLARVEEARTGEPQSGSGTDGPPRGVLNLRWTDAARGELELAMTIKKLPWPKGARTWDHADAAPCSKEVDWASGAGFRLTLRESGRTTVLHDDRAIPRSRHCVLDYNLVEVHAFDAPDGKTVLAILVGMEVRAFEGNDRQFLAVTKVREGVGLSGRRPIR